MFKPAPSTPTPAAPVPAPLSPAAPGGGLAAAAAAAAALVWPDEIKAKVSHIQRQLKHLRGTGSITDTADLETLRALKNFAEAVLGYDSSPLAAAGALGSRHYAAVKRLVVEGCDACSEGGEEVLDISRSFAMDLVDKLSARQASAA
jgi:hypothetical protein